MRYRALNNWPIVKRFVGEVGDGPSSVRASVTAPPSHAVAIPPRGTSAVAMPKAPSVRPQEGQPSAPAGTGVPQNAHGMLKWRRADYRRP